MNEEAVRETVPSDEVPEGWTRISLGEIGDLDTSSVDKKRDPSERAVKLVNYMDVYENHLIGAEMDLMTVTAPEGQCDRSQIRVGDILFTPSSEEPDDIGHSAVVAEELEDTLHSYHTVRLRPRGKSQLSTAFSGWMANAPYVRRQFARRATGSTRYTLTLSDFSDTVVLVPPADEQGKIASVLYTVDELIEKADDIINQIERLRLGLVQDLYQYGVTKDGALRCIDSGPGTLKETQYGRLPEDWELVALDDVVPDDSPITYGIVKPGDHYPGGVPVIRVEDIVEGQVDEEELLHTDPEIHQRYSRAEVQAGDLLFSIRGTVGRMAFVPKELEGSNITQDTARIRVRGANPVYVRWYLETDIARSFVERHRVGQTVQGINLEDLRRVPVALPSTEEQERIVTILSQISAYLERERETRDALRRLRKGLMQDLLTGEVRMKDVDIEIPEEVAAYG